MNLQDLYLKEFLEQTASDAPVPGGGSISALSGAMGASLCGMLAGLTVGKKKYADVEELMKGNQAKAAEFRKQFIEDIDRDSAAYNLVMEAFKMPKETDEEKSARSEKIQQATKIAATVPMEIAERAFEMIDLIEETTFKGNPNAITDGCVSMLACRTAVLGALLNVRINLGSIKDKAFVKEFTDKCNRLEKEVMERELALYNRVKENI